MSNRRNNKKNDKIKHIINHDIKRNINGNEVKLVTESETKVISLYDAVREANETGLDLVLVGASANPPVVKLMDYSKFLYDQNKHKNNTPKTLPLKEMRFRPHTDANDLEFKTKHIIKFLSKGHKVKAFVFFKGREKAFKEKGERLLLQLALDLEKYGIVEKMPKYEGNKMTMFIKPIK